MSAAVTTHPIDLVKVRLMMDMRAGAGDNPITVAINIVKKDGFRGLYKGLSASLLRQATYSMTRFGVYGPIKDIVTGKDSTPSAWQKILSGMLAGAVGAIVGNPADLTMVRMQADGKAPPELRYNYTSVGNGLHRIVREEGILNLWRGSQPTIVRAMLVTAAQLGAYDQFKYLLLTRYKLMGDGLGLHIVASFGAGFVAAVVTNPVDVVKTRIMNQGSTAGAQAPKYAGMIDCFVKIARQEGLSGFYKGFVPNFMRLGPQTIMTFIFYEQFVKLYHLSGVSF
jgi:solute carrier family 25 oxoglutarate transporter 11